MGYLLIIGFAISTIILFWQVFSRFILGSSLSWAEELSRFIMIFMVLIGSSLALRSNELISVEMLLERLTGNTRRILVIVIHLISISLFIVLIKYGYSMALNFSNQHAPSLKISMEVIYLFLPFGGVLLFINSIACIVEELIGKEVAFSLGLSTVLGITLHDTLPMEIVPQRIFVALNSFPLMAIPFFILAGNIMGAGSMSKRLVNFATSLVGHFTGGLAMVAIVTSMFFAAISGSGAATTAAIGSILIPAMIAKGYKIEYAAANQAVSGALGVIIPPSISMILFGVAAEVSIGDLFIAGILPGLLITFSLLVSAFIIAKKNGYVGEEKQDFPSVVKTFKEAILAILMPGIILGGIYTGIFTPTEASVVAVVYSIFIGVFVYRDINIKKLGKVFKESAISSAVIMLVIGFAGAFGFFIGINSIPDMIYESISSFVTNKYVFLILVNIILLIAGMFLEGGAAILILVPLLFGTAVNLGIDPIHFGTIMVCNLAIGLVTPPVGIDLFVVSKLTNVGIMRIARYAIPLILILIVDILIITFVPALSTWLPSLIN